MLSNLASLQRIVGFAGEFQTGFKNSELLGILRGRESGHQLSRSGRITLSQALRSMPFEQTELQASGTSGLDGCALHIFRKICCTRASAEAKSKP